MKNYAELLVESLLMEVAMNNDVIDAIKKRYEVEITYDDGDDEESDSKGRRVIQPVAFFKTPKGNLAIRAYQVFGGSKSNKGHGWKEFKLDNIGDWKANKKRRFKEPPMYNAEGLFNKYGDKGGVEIYAIANFDGQKNDALMKYNKEVNDKKVEKSPYYNLGRGINRGYTGDKNDYLQKNVADWQNSDAATEFRKGNGESLYDMSTVQDFGDTNDSTTNGPVMKNNTETQPTPSTPVSYNGAKNNGPVYKTDATNDTEDNEEYDVNIEDFEDIDDEIDDDFLYDIANRKNNRK